MERTTPIVRVDSSQELSDDQKEKLIVDIIEYVVENCKDCITDSVAEIIPKDHPQFRDIENAIFEKISTRL